MNFKIAFNQLLKLLPQSVVDGSLKLSNLNSIASLERAVEGDISFLGNSKYKSLVSKSNASVILLPKDYFGSPKDNQVFIRMDEPSRGLASLCSHLEMFLGNDLPLIVKYDVASLGEIKLCLAPLPPS